MAKWMNELDVVDFYNQWEDEKLEYDELGKKIAVRLRKVMEHLKFPRRYPEYERQEIREELDDIAYGLEHLDGKEDFELLIRCLYDVADTDLGTDEKFHERPKLLWVKTF